MKRPWKEESGAFGGFDNKDEKKEEETTPELDPDTPPDTMDSLSFQRSKRSNSKKNK